MRRERRHGPMTDHASGAGPLRVAYVLKRYPRLSETFILNELLALEALGVELSITSLLAREPEAAEHAGVRQVRADVRYAVGTGRWRRRAAHVRVAARWPAAYLAVALDTAIAALWRRDPEARKSFRRAVVVADRVDRAGAD